MTTFEQVQPDIACLQEVWSANDRTQADQLADAFGFQTALYIRTRMPPLEPGSGADSLGLAVLSRWPMLDQQHLELPSLRTEDPTVLAVVTLAHPAGRLHVATTVPAWESDARNTRLAQCAAVAAALADPRLDGAAPIVLAADLNAGPGTPELAVLTDVLIDAWAAANPDDPGHTYTRRNQYVAENEWLADGRIDHVLLRAGAPEHPVTINAAMLAGTTDPPPSDHYAVVVDVEWAADTSRQPNP